MKQFLIFVILTAAGLRTVACPACQLQQPRILRGITHGPGPAGLWEYMILFAVLLIFGFTLFYSVKWLIRPGESSGDHIKYFILNDE